jgi:hypothetical protein
MVHLLNLNIGFWGFIMLVFGLAYFVFWIYTLVDIVNGRFRDPSMKVIWVFVILFAQFIGPIIYWVIAKGQKI